MIAKRLRDYRKGEIEENYEISESGFLFHSQNELNKFTDIDDYFTEDNSV